MRFLSRILQRILYAGLKISGWKKKIIDKNLSLVNFDMSAELQKTFYSRLFKNLSTDAADFLTRSCIYSQGDVRFQVAKESIPVLEKMKNGGLMLTAHLQKYETIGPWLMKLGIPLMASYAKIRPEFLDRWIHSHIRSTDGKPYSLFIHNPREILRLLDCGKLFCLIADQDYRKRNFTPGTLFEKSVHCNPLPDFILKNRPNTPIFLCWISFQNSIHTLHAQEIFPKNGKETFEIYHHWLENLVKASPEIWYGWTHRRFLSTMNSTVPKLRDLNHK